MFFFFFLWSASCEDIFDLGSGIWFPGFKYHLPREDFQLSKLVPFLPEWKCLLSTGQQRCAGTACPSKFTVPNRTLEPCPETLPTPPDAPASRILERPPLMRDTPVWRPLTSCSASGLCSLCLGCTSPTGHPSQSREYPFSLPWDSRVWPVPPLLPLITPLTLCSQLQHGTYHIIISFQSLSP